MPVVDDNSLNSITIPRMVSDISELGINKQDVGVYFAKQGFSEGAPVFIDIAVYVEDENIGREALRSLEQVVADEVMKYTGGRPLRSIAHIIPRGSSERPSIRRNR